MNTKRFNIVAVAIAIALPFGLANSVFAGPGPQYWAQQHAKAVAAADAKSQQEMACPKCKDAKVTSLHGGAAGGKAPVHSEVIGTKHSCGNCGGEIKTVKGTTTNDMKSNCPICAKATPTCCKISS